eukprot:g27926.t1
MSVRLHGLSVGLLVSGYFYVQMNQLVFSQAAQVNGNVHEIQRTMRLRQQGEPYPATALPESGKPFMALSLIEAKTAAQGKQIYTPPEDLSKLQSMKISWNSGVTSVHQFLVEHLFLDSSASRSHPSTTL